jgi:hypothetical protein
MGLINYVKEVVPTETSPFYVIITLESELLLRNASNYYYSVITPFFTRVSVWCLCFVVETCDILRAQV